MRKEKERISSGRLWMGSIIAALVSAVAIYLVMLQMEKNVLSEYEKEIVYVAGCEIPKGQILDEGNWQNYVQQKEVDKSCIPATAIHMEEQLYELSAVYGIEEGTILTGGMFLKVEDVLSDMMEPVIAGLKAEDLYQIVGGTLRPGDRIHIYRVSCEGEAMLGWENVFVQQVFDHSGLAISCEDTTTAAQRLNVYLDKEYLEEFYTLLATGSLRVVKALR